MSRFFKYGCGTLLFLALVSRARVVGRDTASSRPLAVVVHKSSAEEDLSASNLRKMFTGDLRNWPNSAPVVVIEQPDESPTQQELLQLLLRTTTAGYKRLLLALQFQGKELPAIRVLNSDDTAIKFVRNVPGAIAIVDAQVLASEGALVKILKVDGRLPGDPGYLLQ
jgi:ABC-type phosphate transport system substrate-binding protein